jgi:putative component of toxin-antitoxin plasmid stabilization module
VRTIVWAEAAIADLGRLDRPVAVRINAAIERLAVEDVGDVKKLHGIDELRLRVGAWRVRFIEDPGAGTLTILRVLPRGSAYR